jgi:hypothetical protein
MNEDDCIVCLETYSDYNKKNVLVCGSKMEHHICSKCFRKIKSINNLCPLCRSEITNEPEKTFIEKIIHSAIVGKIIFCLDRILPFVFYFIIIIFSIYISILIFSGKIKIDMGK